MYPPGPGAAGMPTGAIVGEVGRWEISFWARSMSFGSKFLGIFSSIRFLLIAFVPDGTRVHWERQFSADELRCEKNLRDQIGRFCVAFHLLHILASGNDGRNGWMF